MQNYHPLHLGDLEKSGLSPATIDQAGIKSVPPGQINKCLGVNLPGLTSCYEIPYPGCKDFSRYRCFYDDGKAGPKYLQRKDTGNHLYIPTPALTVLSDPAKPLYLTEGEKKSLKACQEGLPCVGLSGLWNWSNGNGGLIPDFDKITLAGRLVYIVPDNDYRKSNKHGYKKNLGQAVNRLAYALIDQGAKVSVIQLPEDGSEKGLDDFLCTHTVDEFLALPVQEVRKLTLEEMIQEATIDNMGEVLKRIAREPFQVKQEAFITGLSKRLKVSRSAIKKDLKRYGARVETDPTAKNGMKMIALFPGLVDVVDDGGQVAFLIKDEGGLHVDAVTEIEGVQYIPPDREHLPFLLPQADRCLDYHQTDDPRLFDDLLAYLKRFSFLPDERWPVIGFYVLQTYLQDHQDIHYQAMLLFHAVPERGKSRTGKAVANVAYRGVHVVDMREANIFRYSGALGATIFFDVMDLWKKTERNGSEDILLLRFEKGARVARVLYPEKGAFNDTVYYDVHGPTLMASNEPVHKILGSRCILFTMPNAPGNYENPTPELALELKERLIAWRAKMMGKLLPQVEPMPGISGRLWDIAKPLFQICLAVCPSRYEALVEAVLEIAGQRVQEKKESFDGLIIQALHDCVQGKADHYEIATAEVTAKFNELWQGDKPKNEKWMGRRLKVLGLRTNTNTGRSIITISQGELKTILTQYGFYLDPLENNSRNSRNSKETVNTSDFASEFQFDAKEKLR